MTVSAGLVAKLRYVYLKGLDREGAYIATLLDQFAWKIMIGSVHFFSDYSVFREFSLAGSMAVFPHSVFPRGQGSFSVCFASVLHG